ncbi:MAG: orotidine 5'-phosphate decarboxylase / HUMPS family protein [Candidatus Shapirobacteria bacterium]|jgi:bifunctional enzyme Fae/Hps
MILDRRQKYLQVALNSTINEAMRVIDRLPVSERVILEAGTPFIKRYGLSAIRDVRAAWAAKWWGQKGIPYVVADLKTMDRGSTEVMMAREAGASAVVALGQSPLETINSFVDSCAKLGVDSMLDMMNVEAPVKVLRRLKKLPDVVILHRGVDEEDFNRDKPVPYIQINKIRSSFDVMISIAGGDTIREVKRAIFNDADIVVVWRDLSLVEEFLKEVK